MKKSILWMLAAIMTCGIATVLTSCGSDSEDPGKTGSYRVWAAITNNTGKYTETNIKQLFEQYEALVNPIVAKEYGWTVTAKPEDMARVVAENNAKAETISKAITEQLEAIKKQFDAQDKSAYTGLMNLTVTVYAQQTLTGEIITADKQVVMKYENLK